MQVGIFCDASQLYFCVNRKFKGRKVDYKKFIDFIVDTFDGVDTYVATKAYGTKINNEAIKFVSRLNSIGFVTKFVRTTKTRHTSLSINIAMDVIRLLDSDSLDHVILGSANRELIPLLAYLKERGVGVSVVACGVCNEIRNIVSNVFEISEELLEDEATKRTD